MVIYTVLAKKIEKINKKIEKIKKIEKNKNALNNFWGPCQVLNISDTKAELVLSSPLEVNRDMIFTLICLIGQLSHEDTGNKHRHIFHCTKLIIICRLDLDYIFYSF